VRAVREMSSGSRWLAAHREAPQDLGTDVAFFQADSSVLAKRAQGDARPEEISDHRGPADHLARCGHGRSGGNLRPQQGTSESRTFSILSVTNFSPRYADARQRTLRANCLQKLLKGENPAPVGEVRKSSRPATSRRCSSTLSARIETGRSRGTGGRGADQLAEGCVPPKAPAQERWAHGTTRSPSPTTGVTTVTAEVLGEETTPPIAAKG